MDKNVPALTWDHGKYDFQRKLGNFVQFFQVNLQTNGYGIPLGLVDPTIIAENMLDCETTDDLSDDIVEQAIMAVDFDEGMPLVDGLPIWERLDGELIEYYKLFKEYREAAHISGSRSIAKISQTFNVSGKYLSVLSKIYHWQLRCRAYDLYKRMELERARQLQVQKLESKHAEAAAVLLEQSLAYIENHPEQLNPKAALQMLQIAIKTGRLAAGLNPDKPGSADTPQPTTNISILSNPGSAAEVSTSIEVGGGKQLGENTDASYLQSIVHILDKSGALDKAKERIIEADFVEIEE